MFVNSSTHLTITIYRGWLVATASTAMGLVLGILYCWSVVRSGIPDSWGWTNGDKALPYSAMCIVFSLSMVPAGRFQDRYGPRLGVVIGGFLTGLGCIVAGLGGSSLVAYVIGFGILTGTGVGFGYSTLTPTTMKWFPPHRTGMVVGIVVAGNGMAPVLLAPLSTWLLKVFEITTAAGVVEKGVSSTMVALGLTIWLVVGSLFWIISNPPAGFVAASDNLPSHAFRDADSDWRQTLGTCHFWLLYLMYFTGASAGLTFISVAADLGKQSLGELAFLAVVVLALGNTLGRVIAGYVSDRIGRHLTLCLEFLFQGIMIGALFRLSKYGGGWLSTLTVLFAIGLNYGANLAIFPAACKDRFGLRYFGLNYGWLFTAFGLAGLVMPWLNGVIRDKTGTIDLSYQLIMLMMAVSCIVALVSHVLQTRQQREA